MYVFVCTLSKMMSSKTTAIIYMNRFLATYLEGIPSIPFIV